MNKLYLVGGYIRSSNKSLCSCYTYEINTNTWNKIANLNVARDCAACTVFEGKIVFTGGENFVKGELNSVEAYDYHENKWIYLPDLIEERSNHAAVSMGNKMFVIGGYYTTNCEVFDSFSRKFTKTSSKIKGSIFEKYFNAFSIGNNIVVFQEAFTDSAVYLYDVEKGKWINVKCDFSKNLFESSYLKYFT